jgi:enoyl-CoA hydratase/carnithine racemase
MITRTSAVRRTLEDRVLELTLARPEKKNALTEAMYRELADALTAASADEEVSAVIFAAEGGVFSAGNDLADFQAIGSSEEAQQPEDNAASAFIAALSSAPVPLIAAVQGPAVGIGATMLLHCDLVFAAEDSSLHFPFTALGLVPEAGSTMLLPAQLGHARASAHLLLGQPLSARDAHAAGIVTAVLDDGALALTAAREAAEQLTRAPRAAVQATKRLMREPLRGQLDAQVRRESAEFAIRLRSAEAQAAFAVLQKRRT